MGSIDQLINGVGINIIFNKFQAQKSQLIQLAFLHLIEIIRRLAMTYSHMGRPHTTIGAFAFHC